MQSKQQGVRDIDEYNVKAVISADILGFRMAMGEVMKSIATLKGENSGFNFIKSLKLATGLTTALTGAVIGTGATATKTSADFYKGMSKVKAITSASAEEMQEMEKVARHLTKNTEHSLLDITEAMKYTGMAGWNATEVTKGLPSILDLASASGENLATVSDIVTDGMMAFKYEIKDVGKYVDVLAQTARSSNTNVGLMGESFKYASPIASTLGYKLEDIALATGLMASSGIKGSLAGTSLRMALTNLAAPSKRVEKGMKALGISIKDFQGKSLEEQLSMLRSKFKGLSKTQQTQTAEMLFGKRAMSGMLAVINTSQSEYDELKNKLKGSTDSAKEMAQTMRENLASSFKITINKIKDLGVSIGNKLTPKFTEFLKGIGKDLGELDSVIQKDFSKLPDKIGGIFSKIITKGLEALPQIINIGYKFVNGFLTGISQNKESISKSIVGIIDNTARNFISFAEKFIKVGGDIILRVAEGMSGKLPHLTQQAIEAIARLIVYFGENVDKVFEVGTKIVVAIGKGIVNALPKLMENADKIAKALLKLFLAFKAVKVGKQIISQIAFGITGNMGILEKTGISATNAIANVIISKKLTIKNAGKHLVGELGFGLAHGADIIKESASKLTTAFSAKIMSTKIGYIGGSMVGKIAGGIGLGLSKITVVGGKILTTLGGALANPVVLGVAGAGLIGYFVKSLDLGKIATRGGQLVGSLIRGIVTGIPNLIKAGANLVGSFVSGLASLPGKIISGGVGLVKGLISGITGAKSEVSKATETTVEEGVKDGVQEADVSESGRMTISEIKKGITSGETDVATAFKQLIESGLSKADATATIYKYGNYTTQALVDGMLQSGNVKQAFATLLAEGKEPIEAMRELLRKTGAEIPENFEQIVNSMKDKHLSVLDLAEEVIHLGKNNMLVYGSGVEGQTEKIKDIFRTQAKNGLSELEIFDIMFKTGELNIKNFAGGNESMKQELYNTYKELRQTHTALEAYEEMARMGYVNVEKYDKATKEGSDMLKDTYNKMIEMSLNSGKQMGDSTAKGISSKNSDIDTSMKGYFNTIRNNLKTTETESAIQTGNIVTRMIQVIKGKQSEFDRTGLNLILGVSRGINNGRSNIIESASNAIRAAINAAKRMAGIHSPSRVMENEVGKMLSLGMGVGVAKNARSAIGAMKDLVSDMTQTVTNNPLNLGIADSLNQIKSPNINYSLKDNENEKRSLELNLSLGGRSFKAFVDDISNIQNKEIKLKELYAF